MTFLKSILGSLTPAFLLRSYLISAAMFALILWMMIFSSEELPKGAAWGIMLYTANFVLFPFSKLVWEELKTLVLGENVVYLNLVIMVALKCMITSMLWIFSVFIGPFGIIYLWLRSRNSVVAEADSPQG